MIFFKRILFIILFLCAAMCGVNGMVVSDSDGYVSYNQELSVSWVDRKRAIEAKIKEYMLEKKWHDRANEHEELASIFNITLRLTRFYYDRIFGLNKGCDNSQILSRLRGYGGSLDDIGMVAPGDIEKACFFYHKLKELNKIYANQASRGKID